jgi:hypothetical protein
MKTGNNPSGKGQNSSHTDHGKDHGKQQKGKSAMAAADKAESATSRTNPHSKTGLSKNMADTGTNVSYEDEE